MTPEGARAMYRRQLQGVGEQVILRRVTGSTNQTKLEAKCLARVRTISDSELMGGVKQDDQRLIILAEDLEHAKFPVPPRVSPADQVIVRGRTRTIAFVDEASKRIAGTIVAYVVRVTG